VPQAGIEQNGTITLSAGVKYDIVLEYMEIWSWAQISLAWSSSCQIKQIIPTTQLYPCRSTRNALGNGLLGHYYTDPNLNTLKGTEIDPQVNFQWGMGGPAILAGQVDLFSAQWTGFIQPRYSGTYTFYAGSDDGSRLYVDGTLVVDAWVYRGMTFSNGTINLVQGQNYSIIYQYFESGGGAGVELDWSSYCQQREIVPTSQLFVA